MVNTTDVFRRSPTSTMEPIWGIDKEFWKLFVFAKKSPIVDIRLCFKYASEYNNNFFIRTLPN